MLYVYKCDQAIKSLFEALLSSLESPYPHIPIESTVVTIVSHPLVP